MASKLPTRSLLGCVCFAAVLALGWQTKHEQHPLPAAKALSASSASLTDVPTFSAFLPARCDSSGNLYFQLGGGSASYNSGTIMRLARESNQPSLYKAPAELAKSMAFYGFAVTPSGKIFLLEKYSGHYEVLRFDSDKGEPDETRVNVPDHLEATDFAASEAGTVLVGGYYDENTSNELQGRNFLALFDQSGRILREINHEGSVKLDEVRKKLHDGASTTGPDGSFYFLSGTEIMVLSAYGDLVRTIPIQRPEEGDAVADMSVTGDLISIEFDKSEKTGMIHPHFLVLNAATGGPHSLYVPSEELGNNCVCFLGRMGYRFLRVENGKLKFLSAPLT